MRDYYQTMKLSFEQICQGKYPWVPLGNFMNAWYANHFWEREQLIIDPLPDEYPPEFQQWAAFCAASVRWFCATYELTCPSWVDSPKYILAEPWCVDAPYADWKKLRQQTASEFRYHNIYCDDHVYANKYEVDEHGLPLRGHPANLQKRLALVRPANERLAKKWTEEERMIREYMPTALALKATQREREQAVQQSSL